MIKNTKITSILLTFIMLLSCVHISSNAVPVDLDEYLRESGFPVNVINAMPEGQKQFIYENTYGKNLAFSNYETKNFNVNENGDLTEEPINSISPCYSTISSADLSISVIGATTHSADGISYTVLPCFVWNKVTKVCNDSFAMSMYSGWEAIPNAENFRLHFKNAYGNSTYVDINPEDSDEHGYSYRVPSDKGRVQGIYEGYAYYDLDKKSSSASPRISLKYVHDKSAFMNVSYNITIGVGSISISTNSTNIAVMSGNYTVEDLY